VKEALGDDALILSNRNADGGIEVVALAASAFTAETPAPEPAPALPPAVIRSLRAATPNQIAMHSQAGAFVQAAAAIDPRPRHAPIAYHPALVREAPAARVAAIDIAVEQQLVTGANELLAQTARAPVHVSAPAIPAFVPDSPAAATQAAADIDGILSEIQSLKMVLRKDIAAFAAAEVAPAVSARSTVMRELLNAGFSASLARRLALDSESRDAEATMDAVTTRLAGELKIADADEIINAGGVYAFVGPTGVGKTTTVAKLAARAVVRFGAAKVALLTTDSYRIGAHDQLRIYGRILSVPVHAIRDAVDLATVLDELSGRHLILIDTIGMSQRDRMVAEHAAMLSSSARVKRLLLVSTTANSATLNQVVSAYKSSGVHGCILTKTDEAANLAPALDAVIRHGLPVHYITDGQRVPEDLQLPDARALVNEALHPLCDEALALLPDELALIVPQSAAPIKDAAAFIPPPAAQPTPPLMTVAGGYPIEFEGAAATHPALPPAHAIHAIQHAAARVVHG
jgi:flagellar biosynthesis protein FlhF